MDDFYAYTNNSDNNNNQHPQDDPLVTAFTNFGWGRRFNSLIDTVKKQSDVIVEVTKKDLQEFATTLREDTTGLVEQLSHSGTSSNTNSTTLGEEPRATTTNNADIDSNSTNNMYTSLREGLGKINTVNLATLREGLTDTLTKQGFLPSHMTSIKLPDNINLGELRQELDQGTRFAELYLQKFGTEVIQVLNNTISVLEPEGQDSTELYSDGPKIFATRTEALISNLQTDRDALLMDPALHGKEQHIKDFESFGAGFDIQDHTLEITHLLNDSAELRQTMNDLVPLQIDYTTFWKRYFYHVWRINQEEKQRRALVQGAKLDQDDDFKWDSDDEDGTDHQTTERNTSASSPIEKNRLQIPSSQSAIDPEYPIHNEPDTHSTPGQQSSVIADSHSLSSTPQTADGNNSVKAKDEKQQTSGYNLDNDNDSDSDSDWE
ncbi:hypothetical protein BC941DRAFT_428660 [Chlamydoabsidia padenii]|nr:hypothetical protein BC941DRAFT_428660 [Chlamydoabsidia padenii]